MNEDLMNVIKKFIDDSGDMLNSEEYYKLYSIGLIKFCDIPMNKLTKKICNFSLNNDPFSFYNRLFFINPEEKFRKIPLRYRTKEMYLKMFGLNSENYDRYFSSMPIEFLDADICNSYFMLNPEKNIYNIPTQFVTGEMKKVLFDSDPLKWFLNIPSDEITSEMCFRVLSDGKVFSHYYLKRVLDHIPEKVKDQNFYDYLFLVTDNLFLIPDRFRTEFMYSKKFELLSLEIFNSFPKDCITDNMYLALYKKFSCDMCSFINNIPSEFINQHFYDVIFKIDPFESFSLIPEEYITSSMYKTLLFLDISNYISIVPVAVYDDEMLRLVIDELKNGNKLDDIPFEACNLIVGLDMKLFDILPEKYKIDTIINELINLSESFGTIEFISNKYNVSISYINTILEDNIKNTNFELYCSIKEQLKCNQKKWLFNMKNDVLKLKNIVLSLGEINNNLLSNEQRIQFCYMLKESGVTNSLESIYMFASKYKSYYFVNNFFDSIFKYKKLFGEEDETSNLTEDEREEIKNSILWFDCYKLSNDFTNDGKNIIFRKYADVSGKHIELTYEIAIFIINQLKESNIPLNNCIVNEAYRRYFVNELNLFIKELKLGSYLCNNKKKIRKK